MSFPTDNHKCLDHFYLNTNYLRATKKYFHDAAKRLGLSKAKSMISIGPGMGLLDTYIIKDCAPELQLFIGVEPDKSRFDILMEATSTCSNVEFTLVNESLQGWTGPTEPVDVVMLNQVLHYIPYYVSALRQCYEWLKPGGSIIISQSYDDNIFVQMGKSQNSECVHMHLIDCDRIKKDLVEAGLSYLDDGQLAINMTSEFINEDLLLYFKTYIKDLSDEQAVALVRNFREKMKSTKDVFLSTNGIILITKPLIGDTRTFY